MIVDEFLFGETFFTCEKFPMVRSVPTLQKHAWKALFMGRCPKPHQGNDSLGTPFAYGVLFLFIYSAETVVSANRGAGE